MKKFAATILALSLFAVLSFAQSVVRSGGATDTCTGSSCAIGPGGISTDGGIRITNDTAALVVPTYSMFCLDGSACINPVTSMGLVYSAPFFQLFAAGANRMTVSHGTGAITFNGGSIAVASFSGWSSSAASGSNAYAVGTTGARIDFGAGANDYAYSDGTNITFAGPIFGNAAINSASYVASGGYMQFGTTLYTGNSRIIGSSTAPTIIGGFGTTPSITTHNGSFAFRIDVGTGGTANDGVIALPAASNGWNCFCTTLTTASPTVTDCKQIGAGTTTTVTIGNFSAAGTAAAWVDSDIVAVNCIGL